MSLNWNDLKFFLSLQRRNSFVAAADELKVTHSTVARRITALEEALQTQLFQRSERGCRLTPMGEELVPYAEQLESTLIQLKDSVAGHNTELTGAIRIGAPDGIGNSYLTTCLGALQREHHGLDIELIAVPMYYSLAKREIDILITVQKPSGGNIITRKLTSYKLGLFATREYLESHPAIHNRDDLKGHTFIGYIDDLLFDQDLSFMEDIAPGLTIRFRSSTVVAQMNAVASGVGIGVIPYFMANQNTSLVPVLPEVNIIRGYWLQVHPDTRHLARIRATIDFIVERIRADENLFMQLSERV